MHHRLVDEHLRTSAALIMESGDVREVHHVALLLGFGASAVCPYLAYESIDALIDERRTHRTQFLRGPLPVRQGAQQGRREDHVEDGREHGRQLRRFAALRGRRHLRDRARALLPGIHAHDSGGITLEHIARSVLTLHASAYAPPVGERVELRNNGEYQWRRDGEIHLFNPRTVQKLQHATRAKRFDIFKEYTTLVDDQSSALVTLRGLMNLVPSATPLPIDEVESTASIIKRFSTGAMSYGSISEEAHSTLGRRDEPPGREVQHRRGRRGRGAIRHVGSPLEPTLGDQAGRLRVASA